MAWTRVWPLPGQFSPSPMSACRAWRPAPGALATAARETVRLQIQPDPIVASGRAALTSGRRT